MTTRSEDQELALFLCLIAALAGAFGSIGAVLAIIIHAATHVYYCGWEGTP